MEEKICKNCEYKNSPDAKFCFNCGKNLDENQIENNEKTTNVNSKTNVLAILVFELTFVVSYVSNNIFDIS